VALVSHEALCVCHLEEALRLSQPKVTRHLATLRAAGVVADRRDGSGATDRLPLLRRQLLARKGMRLC
jgi:ArsR family transcriptional regulator